MCLFIMLGSSVTLYRYRLFCSMVLWFNADLLQALFLLLSVSQSICLSVSFSACVSAFVTVRALACARVRTLARICVCACVWCGVVCV